MAPSGKTSSLRRKGATLASLSGRGGGRLDDSELECPDFVPVPPKNELVRTVGGEDNAVEGQHHPQTCAQADRTCRADLLRNGDYVCVSRPQLGPSSERKTTSKR
jgi:hypothetical protein